MPAAPKSMKAGRGVSVCGERTSLACWFKSLAVASRPLQRHLAETRISCYNIKVKTATACIFSCVAFATIAAGPPRKIAFGHDGHIWMANIDGTAKKKLVV